MRILLFKEAAKNKNIEITDNVAENLYCRIDSMALDMIINNLIENTVKYTNKNGKILTDKKKCISIKNGILRNKKMIKISINNIKQIDVKEGLPLILALSQNGVFLPSGCGGRGICGMCKTKIISGYENPLTASEEKKLDAQDVKNGFRLACQVIPHDDINIEISEALLSNIKKYKIRITSIKNLTYDIKEITLELSEKEKINFNAGQYIQLEIPPYGKIKTPSERAYSIASTPRNKNSITLNIRYVPNGLATSYIFNNLKVNDKINITGPFGNFFLKESNADMICVAGGSGMSPIRSIINTLAEQNKINKKIWFFFGARGKKDLFYTDEFIALEKKYRLFKFIPALSLPEESEDWKGEKGLITEVLDRYLKTKIISPNDKEGYLCGNPGMINACVKIMLKNGMKENKIYYDKFA